MPAVGESRSLYVHVPFCLSRCSYCDFHSSVPNPQALEAASEAWLAAIRVHLDTLGRRFGRTGYGTVYLGGGSPSCLPRGTLSRTLSLIGAEARAGGSDPVEFTMEANPEDVDATLLDTLVQAGVDRLSIGVQSLEDDARTIAGRRGDALSTMRNLERIAGSWGGRWSADLMYGLPGQSVEGLARDVENIADFGLGHLSLYELTLEEGTPLSKSAASGGVRIPGDDERGDQYDAAREILARTGFKRYEVSNWAIPGQECIHNDVYWNMGDWLAVGPSGVANVAASCGSFLRLENTADDALYLDDPAASCSESIVAGKDAAFECLMTALRRTKGFDLAIFKQRFGLEAATVFGRLEEGYPDLVCLEGDSWRATDRGLDTLNGPLLSALSSAERFYAESAPSKGGPPR
ncbi:MAG: hypothetical protein CVV51_01380 [Spirochaetae bacterium HGW-Spirochaetae-7]|nr:MAG: hypothetical protein CVV51_01380 [Spirochaetae bacterium HGW-Spirochaetae-7]